MRGVNNEDRGYRRYAQRTGFLARRFGMKIVVISGSGLIGTKLVNKLRQHGMRSWRRHLCDDLELVKPERFSSPSSSPDAQREQRPVNLDAT
jgi:hypothetical protein